MKTVYLIIKYHLFPGYVFEKMHDTGKDYQSTYGRGYGTREYDSPYILKRVSAERANSLQGEVVNMKERRNVMLGEFADEARALLERKSVD